jgi:hypothetical protein
VVHVSLSSRGTGIHGINGGSVSPDHDRIFYVTVGLSAYYGLSWHPTRRCSAHLTGHVSRTPDVETAMPSLTTLRGYSQASKVT